MAKLSKTDIDRTEAAQAEWDKQQARERDIYAARTRAAQIAASSPGVTAMLYAVHTDGLVMGIGLSEAAAYADAELHGCEDESLLSVAEITENAARHVQNGGDCRGLDFLPLANGIDLIALRDCGKT